MKRAISLILCLFLCLNLSGCNFSYKEDASFTAVLPSGISTLDPQMASTESESIVINSLFEGLCRIDENGETVPGAAKKWSANDESTVFTFELRRKAKWSNGEKLTAHDFVFAMQRALRPETATPSVEDMFIIKNARAVYNGEAGADALGVYAENDRTLVIELERSYPDFPALTAGMHYMPCNQAYFESCTGHYGLSSQYIITNGPFCFSSIYSWDTDYNERAVYLSRNENYKGEEKVAAQSLSLLIDYDSVIDEDPVTALVEGTVDILSVPKFTAQTAEEQNCEVKVLNDAVTGLLLNPNSSKLGYITTREILIKTLDREDILSRMENGAEASGVLADCVTWEGKPYYSDGAEVFALQDDTVTELIPSLTDLLEINNFPSITVICRNDEESINIANGFIVSWNSKLSNAFNIEPLSDAELKNRIASGNYEAALYTVRTGGTTPYEALRAFESTATPQLMADEEYDAALHSATFDISSYRALENMILENYVFYPIFRDNSYYAANPATRDILPAAGGDIDFTQARKKK